MSTWIGWGYPYQRRCPRPKSWQLSFKLVYLPEASRIVIIVFDTGPRGLDRQDQICNRYLHSSRKQTLIQRSSGMSSRSQSPSGINIMESSVSHSASLSTTWCRIITLLRSSTNSLDSLNLSLLSWSTRCLVSTDTSRSVEEDMNSSSESSLRVGHSSFASKLNESGEWHSAGR